MTSIWPTKKERAATDQAHKAYVAAHPTNTPARQRMVAARTTLLLDQGQAFWGVLSLRLKLVEDPSFPTAWTDGVSLGYNPSWILGMSHAEAVGLIAHEVMHCADGHPWRRDARDHRRWNEACDRVINPILKQAGFKLPQGGLFELDPSHLGKSAEWVYARIPPTPPGGGGQGPAGGSGQGAPGDGPGGPASGTPSSGRPSDGAGSGDGPQDTPDPYGEVRDAPTGGEGDETGQEADWARAVQQAAEAAKAQGKLPASLERFARDSAKTRIDWRSALRRFVQEVTRSDYSWRRPNPRYLAGGLYLPALYQEQLGPIVVAIDTSGSIDQVTLDQFAAELRSVVSEARPRHTEVVYCDARVHRVDTFAADDVIELDPVGGGGTDFRPVFDYVDTMDEPPVCVIYLTDLMGTFPNEEPGVPTLWAATRQAAVPFGEVVEVTS